MLNECVRYGLKLFVNECRKIKENAGHRNAMRVQVRSVKNPRNKYLHNRGAKVH